MILVSRIGMATESLISLVRDSARLRSLPEGMTREESEKGLAEWNKEMSELQKQFQKDQF